MILTRRKNYTGSLRTVWNDEKTVCLGILGTVQGLLDTGIFDRCNAPGDRWAFIPCREGGQPGEAQFYHTREDVLTAARLEEDWR